MLNIQPGGRSILKCAGISPNLPQIAIGVHAGVQINLIIVSLSFSYLTRKPATIKENSLFWQNQNRLIKL